MSDEHTPALRSTRRQLGRRAFLAGASAAGLGLLAGCARGASTGGTPQDQGASTSGAPAGAPAVQTPTKVRTGVIAGLSENVFQYMGQERGFFRDEGIDIEFIEFQAGGPMLKALIAGELEFAESGFGAMPPAVAAGADLKWVGGTKPRLNIALYTKRDINRPEDLVGRSVGTADPGSFLHQLVVALCDLRGIDESRIEFVNIGSSPAVFRAVLAGKVDAGPSTIDWVPEARRSADTKVLLYFQEYLPQYLRTGLMVRGRDLEQRQDVLARTMTAWARSIRYSLDHKDEWMELAVARTGRAADELEFTYDFVKENQIASPNLVVDAEAIRFTQEMNVKAGSQREVLPFDRVASNVLHQQVVARIGTYGNGA